MYSDLAFQVSQLRARSQNVMLTAVTVIVAALFVAALLPSLLVQYVYAGQQLFTEPLLLKFIPLVSFVIGIAYFIYAVIGNLLRAKRANYLEKQMELEDCCCCDYCDEDDEVLSEIESLTESLVKENKKTPAKASAAKRKPITQAKITAKAKTKK
ncbi:hypothetical protein KJ707_03085 [Patescibacteria group bacterium]|nr:hypothetical protein [Patescibacteria group bacterium]MBU1966862.1 hypothetical protein [Patescibacteria group bacterium]MBU2543521.1 hypothetical protein [Patescibacteria group bacterium]